VVYADGDGALAVLYHGECRAPGWFDGPIPNTFLFGLTWRSTTFLWLPPALPVFMVNPSCEATALRRTDSGWVTSTLDGYRAAGLAGSIAEARAQTRRVEGLVATVEQQRLTVEFVMDGIWQSWSNDLDSAVAMVIDSLAAVFVVVTNRIDPGSATAAKQFETLRSGQDAVAGLAEVRFAPEVQRLRARDFDRDARIDFFASCAAAADRALGTKEIDDQHLRAASAACDGDGGPVELLDGRDRMLALLLVAALYATPSRADDPTPRQDEGAHLLVPDEAAVKQFRALYQPVCDAIGMSLGLLPGHGYQADIVVATPERFEAERSRSPIRRGRLAITVGIDDVALGPYRRVLAVPPISQAAPDAVAVNSETVAKRALQQRVLLLTAELDDATANRLVAQMLLLEDEDPTADITFYINSTGGSVTAAMAILDTMRYIKPDVATWVVGLAAGAAQLLVSAGAPGKRYALPHARVMLTSPKGRADPNPLQRQILVRWTRDIAELIAADTGQSVDQVRADLNQERAFSAAEAVEYGLVDHVEHVRPRLGGQ
jgi:ATP-dependent Clp protease protease subunit